MTHRELFIRADSDSTIGTGHIMRCIALAQGWQDQGGEVFFISHCESEALRDRISEDGFPLITVEKPYPHPDDLTQTLAHLNRPSSLACHPSMKWLVLDGYRFTPAYQQAIRASGAYLMVIDDMNHLPYYYADILLNQNIHALDLNYHCDEGTTLLLGSSYVLLRREFLKYRDFKRHIPDLAKNILVTFGGADPDNVTSKVIEALKLLDKLDIMVRIIIGPANPHQMSLRKALTFSCSQVELLINPHNMPELMAWADVAVSAGGSACWELAFFRLPNIILYCADNQKPIAEKLHEKEIALTLGWHTDLSIQSISEAIAQIINSQALRAKMALNAAGLVDGKGTVKVFQALEEIVDEPTIFRPA